MVAALGEVRSVRPAGAGARLEVACSLAGEPIAAGESIAVSGVCVTASPSSGGFAADLSPETVRRTTLGRLRPGTRVNLERALRLSDRIGGHLVAGHVDAVTTVVAARPQAEFRVLRVGFPRELAAELAEKGSVAVDGVSLTVSALGEGWFEVALIPATLATTTLAALQPGAAVNLETDVLAKYVRRSLGTSRPSLADLVEGLGDASG
jgi:riboflavin synthase